MKLINLSHPTNKFTGNYVNTFFAYCKYGTCIQTRPVSVQYSQTAKSNCSACFKILNKIRTFSKYKSILVFLKRKRNSHFWKVFCSTSYHIFINFAELLSVGVYHNNLLCKMCIVMRRNCNVDSDTLTTVYVQNPLLAFNN